MNTEEILSQAIEYVSKAEETLNRKNSMDVPLSFIVADLSSLRAKLESVARYYDALSI